MRCEKGHARANTVPNGFPPRTVGDTGMVSHPLNFTRNCCDD